LKYSGQENVIQIQTKKMNWKQRFLRFLCLSPLATSSRQFLSFVSSHIHIVEISPDLIIIQITLGGIPLGVEVKVKVALCSFFNLTPLLEGVLGEWRYSSTRS
jgi:hypothetical protein